MVCTARSILFSCSSKDNICYGSDKTSEAEIIEVSREANLHQFISNLPEGYDTMVGEKGCQLSGEQKQRIAMARTLLKRPEIMLLDKDKSALDVASERSVVICFGVNNKKQNHTSDRCAETSHSYRLGHHSSHGKRISGGNGYPLTLVTAASERVYIRS